MDTLFKQIYENMVSGRLSAERIDKLSSEYETEQKDVKAAILDLQELIVEIYYKAAGIINIADEDCVALDGRLGMQNRKKKTV